MTITRVTNLTTMVIVVALSALFLPVSAIASTESMFYARYESYPPYCSTPDDMEERTIPPVRKNVHLGAARLAHVTAVIRHGARTPWSSEEACWDGFWDGDSDTAVWDCALTTFLSPPTPRVVNEEEGVYGSATDTMFLFEKKYDALKYPQSNELNGTCQEGQLLLQGYDQELRNGKLLREAYVYDGKSMKHDISMRLLDLSDANNRPYLEPILKYRSDDDQRTLMSGQILLRGLFGDEFVQHAAANGGEAPIIPLHVADRSRDILDANEAICPRLQTLRAEALASKEYKAFDRTEESQTMKRLIDNELKGLDEPLDCLMTTMCTDRTVPAIVNDYSRHGERHHRALHNGCDNHERQLHNGEDCDNDDDGQSKYGSNLFSRLINWDITRSVFPYVYSNGAYSKLGMGPLWSEILDTVLPIVHGESTSDRGLADNKLHVISGHDTTIIPLLAGIGAWRLGDWPAYASMMLLEVYELVDGKTDRSVYKTKFAFRLLYNGNVFTDRVEGCLEEHDLCDFGVLYDHLKEFATRERSCETVTELASTNGLFSSVGGIFSLFFIVVVSAAAGVAGTLWFLQHRGNGSYKHVAEYTNGGAGRGYRDDSDDGNETLSDDKPALLVI